jgi:hypothetical protein
MGKGLFPGDDEQPTNTPIDEQVVGEPLDEDGRTRTPAQQNVGPASEGSGEWPDPDTPARAPAPGAADRDDEPDPAQT